MLCPIVVHFPLCLVLLSVSIISLVGDFRYPSLDHVRSGSGNAHLDLKLGFSETVEYKKWFQCINATF